MIIFGKHSKEQCLTVLDAAHTYSRVPHPKMFECKSKHTQNPSITVHLVYNSMKRLWLHYLVLLLEVQVCETSWGPAYPFPAVSWCFAVVVHGTWEVHGLKSHSLEIKKHQKFHYLFNVLITRVKTARIFSTQSKGLGSFVYTKRKVAEASFCFYCIQAMVYWGTF